MTTINGTYYGVNGAVGSSEADQSGGSGGNGGTAYSYLSGSLTSYAHITGGNGGSGGFGEEGFGPGYGGNGGNAGLGVYLGTGAMLVNSGNIAGGTGGGGGNYGGSGGNGAEGLYLSNASAVNSGTGAISGGSGGSGASGEHSAEIGNYVPAKFGGSGGNGATGVYLSSQSSLSINGGQISGGNAGNGGAAINGIGGNGAAGGAGIDLTSDSTISGDNGGRITGGNGGSGAYGGAGSGGNAGSGGAGIYVASGSNINGVVSGQIIGGSGGSGGNARYYGSRPVGGAGGYGVIIIGNGGNGGPGFSGYGGDGGSGGAGVDLSSGVLTVGGASTGGSLGEITGGNGGNGGNGYLFVSYEHDLGGNGGSGVNLSSATLVNGGDITGGNGGNGGAGVYVNGNEDNGGDGGTGVAISSGTLTNGGFISGGNGGSGENNAYYDGGYGQNGGAGVYLNGGTLTTAGTISGGAAGLRGTAGDAVQFGGAAGTLVVEPGAEFFGAVAAQGNDALELNGRQSGGTGVTLGAQFTGFGTLDFAPGAAWTVDVSANAASANPGLSIAGFSATDTIDIRNLTPTQVAADFNSTNHTLTTGIDGTLNFAGGFGATRYLVFTSDGSAGTKITLARGSGISTILTSTVTLGSAAHPSPLTITNTGDVAPTATGATGVLSNHAGNSLTNDGAIQGGAGNNASLGGLGINLSAGTVTNNGSITGGAGGTGVTTGGNGGSGVLLNGGTLSNSGIVSGGLGGMAPTDGKAGDAVRFGAVASTLNVDPGALFSGQVVANAGVNDVLELSGTQSGGTAITLGTQFTNFSTLDFATGAAWTVDATKAALSPPHTMLTIEGFTTSDTLDITNLAAGGAKLSFNASTEILAITKGATTIDLGFTNPVPSGEQFVFTPSGIGGDLTLQANTPSADVSAHGFSSHGLTAQALAHEATTGLR